MKWSEKKRQKARFILVISMIGFYLIMNALGWVAAIAVFTHGGSGLGGQLESQDAAGVAVAVWFMLGGLLLGAALSTPQMFVILNLPAAAALACCAVFSIRQHMRRPVALCGATVVLSALGLVVMLAHLLLAFHIWY